MALTDKNIVITPSIGQTADPSIVFSAADASTPAQNITVRVYPTNNGTLSFEGSQGQLFSITNNFTGTIFSVNDISGIPSIEVLDTGEIKLAQYNGFVRIPITTQATSTNTGALAVGGGVGIGGNLFVGGNTTMTGNLSVTGLITGNVSLSGSISTATNLGAGTAGQLVYQSAPGLTSYHGPGTVGQILVSNGTSGPLYTNTASIYVNSSVYAEDIRGGTIGQILYQTGPNTTGYLGPGTSGQLLMSAGAAAPVYTNTASIYVNSSVYAEEIRGGSAGQLLFQAGPNLTSYTNAGIAGQVLVSAGAVAGGPIWQNTLTLAGNVASISTTTGGLVVVGGVGIGQNLYVGGTVYATNIQGSINTATNIASGLAGQLLYQSAPSTTGFVSTGTPGDVLVSNGSSVPTFNNTLVLAGTTEAVSTATGAFQVKGGIGVGGNAYIGGTVYAGSFFGSITTASNIAGGAGGSLPYQTSAGQTGFVAITGSNGKVLISNGSTPSWGDYSPPTAQNATTATHLAIGTVNQIPYQSATGRTTWSGNFTYNGTNLTVATGAVSANSFIPAGSAVPTNGLYLPAANSVALATNSTLRLSISSTGTVNSTGPLRVSDTTPSISAQTGALTVAGGAGIAGDLWIGGTLYGATVGFVSTASNIANGAANQIPYQSGIGKTVFSANFTYNGTDFTVGSGNASAYAFVPTSTAVPANGVYLAAANSVGIATNSANRLTVGPTGALTVTGSISAPSVQTTQGVFDTSGSGSALRLLNPGGASYATGTSSITGAIKIKLPVAGNNSSTMLRFTVKIYEYNGGAAGISREINVGGYNYGPGGWVNYFATQITHGGGDINVRFGTDTTSDCIWIGDTNTVWSYPQVFVTDFQAGYNAYTQAIWGSGWTISFATAFDTVEAGPIIAAKQLTSQNFNSYAPTLTGTGASGTWGINITGSAGSTGSATNATNATYTRYVTCPDGNRDANNADKYPNAWTNGLRFDFVGAGSAGTGGNYAGLMTFVPWTGTTASTGDASYQLAFGSTAVNGGGVPKLNIRKGIDTTWNTWYEIHHNGVADAYATASFRAPIFYDSADTAYYVDPNSSSYLNIVGAAGRFYTGYDSGVANSVSCSNWFRSSGATGWYNATHGGGINMEDATWVRVYNNKQFYSQNFIQSDSSVRAPIFYDSNDTAYYVDPASTSRINALTMVGAITINNASPTIYFQDTDHRSAMLHNNSNLFYILRGSAVNSTSWTQVNGYWPVYWNLENNDATFGGNIWAQYSITSYSDARLKENVVTIDNALQKVLKLRGVYYNRISDETKTRKVGVIAQEIQEVLPEVVIYHEDNNDTEGTLAVDYGNISALLIESTKDQQDLIEAQAKRIEEQNQRIEKLEQLVAELISKK